MKTIGLTLAVTGASVALAGGNMTDFHRAIDLAMNRMMSDMHRHSSGDVDRDFVAMMAPHHQGAIDMARLELQYGGNERLRRLAQEIIVTQTQEIDAMHRALDEEKPR